ncbi:MAG: hypothetical protein IT343_23230 [Candidatus Melainabacteria bacterium]|nr:hypothetical protein [Candidatus Melainabacteria bacterium]
MIRNSVFKTLLAAISVLAVVAQTACGNVALAQTPAGSAKSSVASVQPSLEGGEERTAEDDSQEMSGIIPEGEAQVRVRISVPHKIRPDSTITLYPYPVRPPKLLKLINKIDDNPKSLRAQLLNLGYAQRSSDTRLFPIGGWRWKYIINSALAKSGTRSPTNIITMYPWTFKMVPYVQTEVRRINQIEEERKQSYAAAMKNFEENGVDLENEALHQGLAPVEIAIKKGKTTAMSGTAIVPPGTWYVVATHKTPNLKFYWQIPVTVSAGERSTVQLTQTNALVIQGDW